MSVNHQKIAVFVWNALTIVFKVNLVVWGAIAVQFYAPESFVFFMGAVSLVAINELVETLESSKHPTINNNTEEGK